MAETNATSGRAETRRLANAIRALSMDAVQAANSGHPGLPMGCADIATVLFRDYLKYDAADPHWPDRDRFVLSAGHGSMLLYSLPLFDRVQRQVSRSTTSNISEKWAVRAPDIPSMDTSRESKRRPVRSARASRTPWAWRWPNVTSTRASATSSSITMTYVLSRATAILWKGSATRRFRSQATSSFTS